ncbi:DUF2927 domain-containing protein [Phaeobacter sp.]|uniref:DUF2927 domain-containing protein n=1 Tax=Phaeobacter sp. TaxID=1902409 RepID=UPI00345A3FC3
MVRTSVIIEAGCDRPAATGQSRNRPLTRGLFGALVLVGGLTACAPHPSNSPPDRAELAVAVLPPIKRFARPHPVAPRISNIDIARDFLDLHFQLESGTQLPVFTRFDRPIRLRISGNPSAGMRPDLEALLARLRSEAGIAIALTNADDAEITLEAVPRRAILRASPGAACFVVPNVASLAEFRRNKRQARTSWADLRQRQRLAIIVPNDVSPQETRDCLHEELAQAIGPLNDLYRLPNSIFNDDNIHTVLTGFDMLILRASYAPELRTGMTRSEVATRLPAILARLNPAGERLPARPLPATPRSWIRALEGALAPNRPRHARLPSAYRAAAIARDLGWRDHRRAFNHYVLGRILQAEDPDLAQQHFTTALQVMAGGRDSPILRARIAAQMAAYDLSQGDGAQALARLRPAIPVAARAENAGLLATLMLQEAEARYQLGQRARAHALVLDSQGWARYGFGPDWGSHRAIVTAAQRQSN